MNGGLLNHTPGPGQFLHAVSQTARQSGLLLHRRPWPCPASRPVPLGLVCNVRSTYVTYRFVRDVGTRPLRHSWDWLATLSLTVAARYLTCLSAWVLGCLGPALLCLACPARLRHCNLLDPAFLPASPRPAQPGLSTTHHPPPGHLPHTSSCLPKTWTSTLADS